MAEICIVCNEEIEDKEDYYRDEGVVMHFKVCRPEYFENPEKYGGKAKKELTPSEEEQNKENETNEEKTKKVVVTSVDISFDNAFSLTAKFFFASLVFLFLLALVGLGFAALFGYLQG